MQNLSPPDEAESHEFDHKDPEAIPGSPEMDDLKKGFDEAQMAAHALFHEVLFVMYPNDATRHWHPTRHFQLDGDTGDVATALIDSLARRGLKVVRVE